MINYYYYYYSPVYLSTYVEDIDMCNWYFGKISKADAETILQECNYNAFLIRKSSKGYCISMIPSNKKTVRHLSIFTSSAGLYVESKESGFYSDIFCLVDSYRDLYGFFPGKILALI